MEHKNYNMIDLIKYICAILVIVVHVNPFLEMGEVYNFVAINIFGRIAVPFFFIANGYFFAKSYQKKGMSYFKKYLFNITKKYLVWSLLYLPFGIYWVSMNTDLPVYLYPVALIYAFFNVGTFYHLWYIPALIFSLVMIVYLSKKISYKWLLLIASFFYLIGASETYASYLSPMLSNVLSSYISIFYTTRNGLFYGLIFVLLGFICVKRDEKQPFRYNGLAAVFCFSLIAIEAINLYHATRYDFNFLFMLVPFTYFLFQYALHTDLKLHLKGLRDLGGYYYFVHAMVIEFIPMILGLFHLETLFSSGIFRLISVLIFTHLVSMAILYVINRKKTKLTVNEQM